MVDLGDAVTEKLPRSELLKLFARVVRLLQNATHFVFAIGADFLQFNIETGSREERFPSIALQGAAQRQEVLKLTTMTAPSAPRIRRTAQNTQFT